jgi:hypothetical protein
MREGRGRVKRKEREEGERVSLRQTECGGRTAREEALLVEDRDGVDDQQRREEDVAEAEEHGGWEGGREAVGRGMGLGRAGTGARWASERSGG